MSGQELELHHAATPAPLGVSPLPSEAEFALIMRQADIVSRSGIVPASYRTQVGSDGRILVDKRPNVVVATLFGRTFGWDLLTAIRNIHVIEGAAALKPEAALAMVRARGHRVRITRGDRSVHVWAKRADTGDEMEATFSFDDAVRAGLCHLDEHGQPRSRSDKGKPLNWETYPIDMCQWRAVSVLNRGLFGDVVLGLGYTPEELGAIVDAEGVPVDAAPLPSSAPPEEPPATLNSDDDAAATPQEESPAATESPQDPWQPPTLEQELLEAQKAREARNAARRGPALNQAKARAWDAIKRLHPGKSDGGLTAELEQWLAAMNTTLADAKEGDWTELAENLEGEHDNAIRARHATGESGLPAAGQPEPT